MDSLRTTVMRTLVAVAMLATFGFPAAAAQGSALRRLEPSRGFGLGWFGQIEGWCERQQWQ